MSQREHTEGDLKHTDPSPSVDLLTPAEVAKKIGKTEDGLQFWRVMRTGPPVTKLGKKVFYRRDSFEKWIRDQEQGA